MGSLNQERANSQTESPPQSINHSSGKSMDYPPPPTTTTYPTHPPPPMYYQNPHYPQYPNAYHPHPGYHYPQPAPYYAPPPSYERSSSSSCARCCRSFISCFLMIMTLFFLMSLLLALTLHPQQPEYKVASLSVTNFTTQPILGGQWDAKISIGNPNDKLVSYFSDFKVDMSYKDGIVGVNHAPGLALNTKDQVDVDMKGLLNQANGNLLDKKTMDDLVRERGTGSVTFTLRVSSMVILKSGSLSSKREELVAVCEGLKVTFQNNDATSGELDNKGKPVECMLYL
ncbi:hypothetical protein VNO80_14250 [Phaseolus coccineus]|uniref:Late embryogenesis abundant protein LEA-2 subgroup domain-containing protein n=1 Tax=Phaseolus coccineus TaxID=3886 RepID=A0AAN9MHK0_PHACN